MVSVARACVGVVIVVCATYFAAGLYVDDLGFVYDGARVIEVDPGGAADRAGLKTGDLVVVDPFASAEIASDRGMREWVARSAALIEAGNVRFEVQREARRIVVDLHPEGPTLEATIRQLKDAITNVPLAVTFFALACLFVLRARRAHPAGDRFAVGLALCGSYFALRAVVPHSAWMLVLWTLAPSLSVLGYMLIAQAIWLLAGHNARHVSAVLAVAFAAGILLDTYAVLPEPPFHNLLQWLGHAAMFLSIVGGLAVRWRASDERAARNWARLSFVLVTTGLLLPLVAVAAPSVFAGINLGALYQAFWQLFAIVPIAITATAGRAGLLELDGRLPGVILFAVSLGVAWLIYGWLDVLVDAWFPGTVAAGAARMVSFAIVITAAEPLRTLVRRGIDFLFARDSRLLIARCSQLCAELARIEDRAAIELAVRNVLHAHTARLCELAAIVDDTTVAQQLAASGSLRIAGASGVDTLVHIPGGTLVLALALPLAAASWDRAERNALASVGRVIGSMMQERAARKALEARLAREEAERRGIAMELHDGLGATLTAARLMTQMVRRSGAAAPATDTLEGLETMIQAGLHDLRIALWGLDEHARTFGDLVSRLRRQLGDMCAFAGLSLELDSDLAEADSGGPAVGLTVFRLVQEAATNTVKHANAKRVRCSLRSVDGGIQLVFEDDGRGLPSPVPAGRGLGNMKRRAAALGGEVQLSRPPGGGTRIEVWFAIPHDHASDARDVTLHHG
jgi:signal transduction histidine kinase